MKLSEMAVLEIKYKRIDFVSGFAQHELGFEPVKNSEEEIAKVIMEMNDRIDGVWDTERDVFNKYLTNNNISFSSKAILSTAFMEMNTDIL